MVRLQGWMGVLLLTGMGFGVAHGDQWVTPTKEELSMTSIPQVPGAKAVILDRYEFTDDAMHSSTYSMRIKVLSEGGKESANVELPYVVTAAHATVQAIAGRTIQPDGTVVMFTGKPYDKLIEKGRGMQFKAKVFTLPAVQVGSILEYRYKLFYEDNYFFSPDWLVQGDLYVRRAHYEWKPTSKLLTGEDGKVTSQSVAWTPILPPGVTVKQTEPIHTLSQSSTEGYTDLSLDVKDIPPVLHEAAMPPLDTLSYRVMFYYTSVKTPGEYWKQEGKFWSKAQDKFIGPHKGVKEYTDGLVAANDTQEQKLRKIYAAVMTMENTRYTRARTSEENRAEGLKNINNTDDVLTRKAGSDDELTQLFVAMARAAGMKAYVVGVANREKRIFLQNYLTTRQLDDLMAIVVVDGKEQAFDPGERYCPYGHIAWQHTLTGGLRETETGTALMQTGEESYKWSHLARIGDLTLDDHGVATGTITLKFEGNTALAWRHEALRGDEESVRKDLRSELEQMMPGAMEVKVTDIRDLTDGEKPLVVTYAIKGALGSSTGKRLLIPRNLFETNEKPKFPEQKRELAVDLHYPRYVQDAVRLKYPVSMTLEGGAPAADKQMMEQLAAFSMTAAQAPQAVTTYRNFMLAQPLFYAKEYPELRAFYQKMEARDQEMLVFTHTAAAAQSGSSQ